MRRAAIRSARLVSRRIASAAGPVTGAMVAARSSRLASTCWPEAAVMATEPGAPSMSKGTPCGWAAGRAGAQIGPVAALVDAQHVAQLQAGPGDRLADRVGEGGDERAGAVADDDGRGELLAGQDARRRARRWLAALWRSGGSGRSNRNVTSMRRRGPRAPTTTRLWSGDEAEQVRDDGQQVGGGADAKRL